LGVPLMPFSEREARGRDMAESLRRDRRGGFFGSPATGAAGKCTDEDSAYVYHVVLDDGETEADRDIHGQHVGLVTTSKIMLVHYCPGTGAASRILEWPVVGLTVDVEANGSGDDGRPSLRVCTTGTGGNTARTTNVFRLYRAGDLDLFRDALLVGSKDEWTPRNRAAFRARAVAVDTTEALGVGRSSLSLGAQRG